MATRLNTHEEYAALLGNYDTFLFDCDGVLWNGDSIVDGVTDVLSMLRSKSERGHPTSESRSLTISNETTD